MPADIQETLDSFLQRTPAQIIKANKLKGDDFETHYNYKLTNFNAFKEIELEYVPQCWVTPYWRIDGVYGEPEAIKILKTQDVSKIRNCEYFWGYVENKNKDKRVNMKIARKQITINNMLLPYVCAVVQKNNGTDSTWPEMYKLAGISVLDASDESIKNLTSILKTEAEKIKLSQLNIESRINKITNRTLVAEKKKELIETLKQRLYTSRSQPVINSHTSASEIDSPTITETLGYALFFDCPVCLSHLPEARLNDNAKKLVEDARKFLPFNTPEKTISGKPLHIIEFNPANYFSERIVATYKFGHINLPGASLI